MVSSPLANLWCRIYKHIYGNATKKDIDFQECIEESFGEKNLIEFLEMVNSKDVSANNAKDIMMRIIDGEEKSPLEIAKDSGYLGGPISDNDLEDVCNQVLEDDKAIVDKIKATGVAGPIKALVGNVMKRTNRRGDPKKIFEIIKAKIDKM